MPEYSWEEKDRHPVLRRKGIPLIFSSAWKPDPTQLNSGSNIELDKENYSKFHENQPDDPRIMTEVTWSEKCFSINQIAASAEIYDILEYTCNVHNLPLGLTWISDRRDYNENSNGKLRIVESACYLNDITMDGFVEACGQHHLEEGQGAAGKALQLNGMYFIPDVSKLSADAYPFVCDAWEFGLHAAVSFKLENTHMSRVDYILELFLPAETKEVSEHKLLIDGISSILQKNCRNSWAISGMELSEDNMDSVVRSEGAMTDRSLPALLDHGIEIGVEAHEQDVEEQNSTFEAASNEIASILQQKSRNSWKDFSEQLSGANFSSEVWIENFETSDVRPAGISESYHSLNSSEVRKFCNISNPTSDGVEVQEACDQEMGEQNSACGAASNEITSTLQKNPWKSWKDNSGELSGADFSSDVRIEEVGTSKARPAAISDSYLNSSVFMELCNISNPASDGEEVQEARDQEVEEQDSAFVPAAPSPDNEEISSAASEVLRFPDSEVPFPVLLNFYIDFLPP
uniref:NLP1-9 GAF domain-containing protein n=1 Tax=Populus alba TaxID=43335 RepID=A0A4U5PNX8_POPAL|nr:uncharacterized protein D5086_0000199850 [Populus alba]